MRCQATGGGGNAQTAVPGTRAPAAATDSSREAPMSPIGNAAPPLLRPPVAKGEVLVSLVFFLFKVAQGGYVSFVEKKKTNQRGLEAYTVGGGGGRQTKVGNVHTYT